jgi:hypothetical protein
MRRRSAVCSTMIVITKKMTIAVKAPKKEDVLNDVKHLNFED